MGAPAYRGCPLRDAPFSWCEVHRQSLGPCRSAAERDYDVLHEDHPFAVYAWLILVLQYRYGAGMAASSPPPRNGSPAFFLPLFTQPCRRKILGCSLRGVLGSCA
jgi:hypothetical protein